MLTLKIGLGPKDCGCGGQERLGVTTLDITLLGVRTSTSRRLVARLAKIQVGWEKAGTGIWMCPEHLEAHLFLGPFRPGMDWSVPLMQSSVEQSRGKSRLTSRRKDDD